MTGIGNALW